MFSSIAPKHCNRLLERGLVLPITVVPECLSNKALARFIVTLISEIISLDIFPFVGSGKIQVLHISHDTCSSVESAGSQKVSCFVIPLYFRDDVGFLAVLYSQSRFVFKMIVSKWENFPTLRKEMMIAENKLLYGSSGISNLLFSPLIYCFYSIAGTALQLEAASYSKSA